MVPCARPFSASGESPRGPRRAGFTLVEILICVVIMAIAAAVALPMIGSRADLRLSASARKMFADLQYAQSLAISSQAPQYIRFTANQYELLYKSGTSLVASTHPINKNAFTVYFNNASQTREMTGVTLDAAAVGSGNILQFDSLGAPNAYNSTAGTSTALSTTTSFTIRSGGRTTVISVAPYTGEITVSP